MFRLSLSKLPYKFKWSDSARSCQRAKNHFHSHGQHFFYRTNKTRHEMIWYLSWGCVALLLFFLGENFLFHAPFFPVQKLISDGFRMSEDLSRVDCAFFRRLFFSLQKNVFKSIFRLSPMNVAQVKSELTRAINENFVFCSSLTFNQSTKTNANDFGGEVENRREVKLKFF